MAGLGGYGGGGGVLAGLGVHLSQGCVLDPADRNILFRFRELLILQTEIISLMLTLLSSKRLKKIMPNKTSPYWEH